MKTLAAIAVVILLAGCDSAPRPATITVLPSVRYQTITGWEATAWAGEPSASPERYRDRLLEMAVEELGITRLRVHVRSGAESDRDDWSLFQRGDMDYASWRGRRYATVNDNDDPFEIAWSGFQFSELDSIVESLVLPMKARLEARGGELFVNLNYVAFTGQMASGLEYAHDDPEEYAEFVLATYMHLDRKYSLVPNAWEVILEPDNVDQWSGTLIGRSIVAAARRLEAAGYEPRFIAPSNTSMAAAIDYFDEMIEVPGALSYLSEFAYHRYRDVSTSNLRKIAERAVRHDVQTAQLEKIGATHETLHEDLAIGLNSAWSQYTLAGTKDNGGHYFVIGDVDSTTPTIRMGKRTGFLRQYFKYVRPGAVRVGAEASDSAFRPLAFVDSGGGFVVVIDTATAGDLTVLGLPEGTYGVSYTTDRESGVVLPAVRLDGGGSLRARIPGAGVVTIDGRGVSAP